MNNLAMICLIFVMIVSRQEVRLKFQADIGIGQGCGNFLFGDNDDVTEIGDTAFVQSKEFPDQPLETIPLYRATRFL